MHSPLASTRAASWRWLVPVNLRNGAERLRFSGAARAQCCRAHEGNLHGCAPLGSKGYGCANSMGTNAHLNLSSGPLLGRPKWDVSSTLAPFSVCRIRTAVSHQLSIGDTNSFGSSLFAKASQQQQQQQLLMHESLGRTRYFRVGTAALMRVSSVILLPSRGTFRSARTCTGHAPCQTAATSHRLFMCMC